MKPSPTLTGHSPERQSLGNWADGRKGLPGWHGLPAFHPLLVGGQVSRWVAGEEIKPSGFCPWPELVML